MPSLYVFDAFDSKPNSQIEVIDTAGNHFRIEFDRTNGGIIINKMNPSGSDQIVITAIVSNEIKLQ